MKTLRRTDGSKTPERFGSCHRCGWNDQLMKVGRDVTIPEEPRRRPRWLCADCVSELRPMFDDGRIGADLQAVGDSSHRHDRRRPAA